MVIKSNKKMSKCGEQNDIDSDEIIRVLKRKLDQLEAPNKSCTNLSIESILELLRRKVEEVSEACIAGNEGKLPGPDPVNKPNDPPPNNTPVVLNQFTPQGGPCIGAQFIIESTEKAQTDTNNPNRLLKGHGLEALDKITAEMWKDMEWDGVPRDLCSMSKAQICDYAFPNKIMRGLKQLYEKKNPFKDPKKPTVAEIEDWHVNVINHLRDLFGIKVKIEKDRCLYLQAHWAQEKFVSRKWDSPKYPNTCAGKNILTHCGFAFVPDCEDQKPYLNGGSCCEGKEWKFGGTAGGEGLLGGWYTTPWVIRLNNIIGDYVCGNGTTGHMEPVFIAPTMGASWFCGTPQDPSDSRYTAVRFVWGKTDVRDPKYCEKT
jgi:hypothetical protein